MNVLCRSAPLSFDAAPTSVDDARHLWWVRAVVLLSALGLVRLLVVAALPLSDGEAYYYMWARFPAWSYYDHPPMIAWLSWLTTLPSHSPFAVRLGPIACAELTGALVYTFGARLFSPRAGFIALVLISVLPVFWVTSLVLNPEAPLAPAWVLALLVLWTMRERTEAWWPPLLGLVIGIAFLSKYTGLLLVPVTLLFCAVSPAARRWWRRPAFYLGGLVALLVVSPVIGWNIAHGWPSLKLHLVERVAVAEVSGWSHALHVAIGQIGSFHPLLFPGLLAALWVTLVRARRDARFQLLAVASWPVLLFLGAAMIKVPDSESHWTMVGFLAVAVAAAGWVDEFIDRAPTWFRWYARVSVATGLLAGFAGFVHARTPIFLSLFPAGAYDGSRDVTNEFVGWDQVRSVVTADAAELGSDAVVASTQYSLCAHLMYALDDRPSVYCPSARRTQFDFLDRHTPPLDAPVLFVNDDHYPDQPDDLLEGRACEPLPTVTVERGGLPVQHYHLYACRAVVPPGDLVRSGGLAHE